MQLRRFFRPWPPPEELEVESQQKKGPRISTVPKVFNIEPENDRFFQKESSFSMGVGCDFLG